MIYSRMTYHCRLGDAAIAGHLDDGDLTVNITAGATAFALYGDPDTVLATLDSMRTAAEQAIAKALHPSSLPGVACTAVPCDACALLDPGEPPTVNEARAAGLIGVERARQAINGGAA